MREVRDSGGRGAWRGRQSWLGSYREDFREESQYAAPMRALAIALLVLALMMTGCKSKDEAQTEADAVAAAEAWLALVDGERYDDSWNEAASYFKGAVTSVSWQAQVGAVRKPLGKLVSRKLKSKQYATSLPGAPDGKYVVIQYDSVFASKASAIETVTPMADTDGKWRVSGYYIR